MTREDLRKFCRLDIDFASIGLMEPGAEQEPYFCTPLGAEYVGRTGCDGVHFVLLPGEEGVFCVDPAMGEPGRYVLPVAADFRAFLSFVLFCRDAGPLAQICWLEEAGFRQLLKEGEGASQGRSGALEGIARAFGLEGVDPYGRVKALQAAFDAGRVPFSEEYYNALGLERPGFGER